MTIFPGENLFAHIETVWASNSHSHSFSLDQHEMPLNIDMKIIRPGKSSGSMLIFDRNSWTLLQSCNAVNPGKYSTRVPLAHHQLCPKLCIVMNFWTTSTCLPMHNLMLGSDSSFQDVTQNPNIHKPSRARDWWLLHHQLKIIVSMKNPPS